MKKVALIPARSGSKRIKDKNIKTLGGIPLIQYTLDLVSKMDFFDEIFVSTDSRIYESLVRSISEAKIHMRASELSGDTSPDIDWILSLVNDNNFQLDTALFILRPTSPFRDAQFILDAWLKFEKAEREYDSLRAISRVTTHPGKMWTIVNNDLMPLYPFEFNDVPWHSNQTQSLPSVYVQTASLEIVWLKTITMLKSLSGSRIMPYVCDGKNAFDINDAMDWKVAEAILDERNY